MFFTPAAKAYALRALLFFIISFILNGFLINYGIALNNSDTVLQPLWSDGLRHFSWSAFPFQQGWGGTTLATLRGVLVPIIGFFIPGNESYLYSHFIFSYCIIPTLIAVATYFAATAMYSPLVSTLCAAGALAFPLSWVGMLGNDYYFFLIITGLLILGIKLRNPNPLPDLPLKSLFASALLIGLSLYNFRGSIIYAIVFVIPWNRQLANIKTLLRPLNLLEKSFFTIACILLIIQLRLDLFGPELGEIISQPIKLHSNSNFKFLIIVLLIYTFIHFKSEFTKKFQFRTISFALGLALGFLPEIINTLTHTTALSKGFMVSNSVQTVETIAAIPHSLFELLTGEDHLSPYIGLDRNFPLIFGLLGTLALAVNSIRFEKDRILGVTALLSLLAYSKIYMTGPAESRYLFPLFPVLLLFPGVLLSFTSRISNTKLMTTIATAFILFNYAYQINGKVQLTKSNLITSRESEIKETLKLMGDNSLNLLLTDSYWNANILTFASQRKILATSNQGVWGPLEARKRVLSAETIALALEFRNPDADQKIELLGEQYKLELLGRKGKLRIYSGTRQ